MAEAEEEVEVEGEEVEEVGEVVGELAWEEG